MSYTIYRQVFPKSSHSYDVSRVSSTASRLPKTPHMEVFHTIVQVSFFFAIVANPIDPMIHNHHFVTKILGHIHTSLEILCQTNLTTMPFLLPDLTTNLTKTTASNLSISTFQSLIQQVLRFVDLWSFPSKLDETLMVSMQGPHVV